MFGLGTTELIIVLLIVLVLFGGRKLKNLGSDLGGAISEFKSSLNKDEGEEETTAKQESAPKKVQDTTSTSTTQDEKKEQVLQD